MNRFKVAWQVLTGQIDFEEIARQNAEAFIQADQMAQEVRKLDDKLFALSQCTDADSIRRLLNPMIDGMMQRKQIESKRIADILTPELKRTYGR